MLKTLFKMKRSKSTHTVVLFLVMFLLTLITTYILRETFANGFSTAYCLNTDKCRGRPFGEGISCDMACGPTGGCSPTLICRGRPLTCQKEDLCPNGTLRPGDACKPNCPNNGGCGDGATCTNSGCVASVSECQHILENQPCGSGTCAKGCETSLVCRGTPLTCQKPCPQSRSIAPGGACDPNCTNVCREGLCDNVTKQCPQSSAAQCQNNIRRNQPCDTGPCVGASNGGCSSNLVCSPSNDGTKRCANQDVTPQATGELTGDEVWSWASSKPKTTSFHFLVNVMTGCQLNARTKDDVEQIRQTWVAELQDYIPKLFWGKAEFNPEDLIIHGPFDLEKVQLERGNQVYIDDKYVPATPENVNKRFCKVMHTVCTEADWTERASMTDETRRLKSDFKIGDTVHLRWPRRCQYITDPVAIEAFNKNLKTEVNACTYTYLFDMDDAADDYRKSIGFTVPSSWNKEKVVLISVIPKSGRCGGVAGRGTNRMRHVMLYSTDKRTLVHEFLHTLSVGHSETTYYDPKNNFEKTVNEYGDKTSIMGSGMLLTAMQAYKLGLVRPIATIDVSQSHSDFMTETKYELPNMFTTDENFILIRFSDKSEYGISYYPPAMTREANKLDYNIDSSWMDRVYLHRTFMLDFYHRTNITELEQSKTEERNKVFGLRDSTGFLQTQYGFNHYNKPTSTVQVQVRRYETIGSGLSRKVKVGIKFVTNARKS